MVISKNYSNISPSPTDIKIQEFLTPEGNIFLIDVAQSQNPPHQSSADGRYYLRLERDAKPAPHGIVQALFNKRRVPNLFSEIFINECDDEVNEIIVNLRNESNIPAEKVSILISVHNVEDIDSQMSFHQSEDSGFSKFTTNQNLPGILVQIIHSTHNFKIRHRNKNYAIFVGYWGRDMDIRFDYVCFSPQDQKIIAQGNHLENPNFYEFLEEL